MTTLYVDASAWGKLVVEEDESDSLQEYANAALAGGDRLVSSELLTTELFRLAARMGVDPGQVAAAMSVLHLVLPGRSAYRVAGLLPGSLRSLDALHVASALDVGADAFVSYDQRQLEAAVGAGIPGVSPE